MVFLLPLGPAVFLVRLTLGKLEGDFLYVVARGRPPPFATPFPQLVAGFSGGMACTVLPAKRVLCVQRSGDTAVAIAEACCQSQSEPTGNTVRTTPAVYVLC